MNWGRTVNCHHFIPFLTVVVETFDPLLAIFGIEITPGEDGPYRVHSVFERDIRSNLHLKTECLSSLQTTNAAGEFAYLNIMRRIMLAIDAACSLPVFVKVTNVVGNTLALIFIIPYEMDVRPDVLS